MKIIKHAPRIPLQNTRSDNVAELNIRIMPRLRQIKIKEKKTFDKKRVSHDKKPKKFDFSLKKLQKSSLK